MFYVCSKLCVYVYVCVCCIVYMYVCVCNQVTNIIIFLMLTYFSEPFCYDGDVRLVNGPVEHWGRVEICFNETWGTITDDFWSYNDGKIICRQLGYSDQGILLFCGLHHYASTYMYISLYSSNLLC